MSKKKRLWSIVPIAVNLFNFANITKKRLPNIWKPLFFNLKPIQRTDFRLFVRPYR